MACCPPAFGVLGRKAAARAEDLEPRQLAACAWALASCRQRSPEWLEALRLGLGRAAGLRELAPLCWAWAASEADSGVLEEALLRAKLLLNERDSPESLLQLAWAASFGAPGRSADLLPRVEEMLRSQGRLLDQSRAKGRRQPPLSSQ
ncbi:unnamed protein product, partial [Effrenium voratum]